MLQRSRAFLLIVALSLFAIHSSFAQENGLPKILQLGDNGVIVSNATELNSEFNEGAPVVTPDNKHILFTSKRTGKDVLYAVTLEGDKLGEVVKYLELPGKEQINTVSFTHDGMTVIASCSDRKDGIFKSPDIYNASYEDGKINIANNLGRPLNDDYWDTHPAISPDGKTLLFVSDREDRDGDIYIATRADGGSWSAPQRVPFNTGGSDLSPAFSDNGRFVYFASDDISGGMGGLDIYVIEYNGNNTWGTPRNLGSGINSRANEFFLAVTPSGDQAFFASDRDGGVGGSDIYRIVAKPIVEAPKMATLQLRVINAATGQPIQGRTDIRLLAGGEELPNESMNDQFAATMLVGTAYEVAVGADGFVPATTQGSAPMTAGPFVKEIRLNPSKARIFGNVMNVMTQKPVQATLMIENLENGNKATVHTDASGAYSFNANPASRYRISTEVEDYDNFSANVEVPQAREEMVSIERHIRLQPATIDAVMLYFDFNKSNLSKDQLSKMTRFIAQVKENPYVRIEVNGHTDDVGSDEYNEKLSERRALTVEDYLLSQSVPRDQLAIVKGFGKAAPLVAGTSEEARAQNRRVEVRIVGMDK